jgi:four helix bundle protein
LYRLSRGFPKEELYGITSQLRRAAISIGANLAEGYGRPTNAEMARFVRIAMGSASEQIIICCCAKILDLYPLRITTGYLGT